MPVSTSSCGVAVDVINDENEMYPHRAGSIVDEDRDSAGEMALIPTEGADCTDEYREASEGSDDGRSESSGKTSQGL